MLAIIIFRLSFSRTNVKAECLGQVCRAGCQACAEVLLSLGKAMEAEVETLVKELLQKSSDTNKFIRQKSSNKVQS